MKIQPKITIADHFPDLSDPRVERTKHHLLIDIVTIAICAVICGANNWVAIETYGKAKQQWLKPTKFVDLTLEDSLTLRDHAQFVLILQKPGENGAMKLL